MLNPANRSIFFGNVSMRFKAAYATIMAMAWAPTVATIETMASETIYFGWTGNLKRAREWIDSRHVDEFGPRTYALSARLWEKTVSVDELELEDDQYGLLSDAPMRVGQMLAKERDYQLRDLWFNLGSQQGAYQTGVDGVAHWGTTHPVNFWDSSFGTYTNDYRGAAGVTSNGVANVGGPLDPVAYMKLRQDVMMRKSESGEAIGLNPNVLMHGPMLDTTAKTILQAEYFSPATFYGSTGNVGNVQNLLRNTAVATLNQDFPAGSLDWLVLCTCHGILPFTIGMRRAERITPLVSPTDPNVFFEHKIIVGGDARWVPGWGLPFLSSISGPTAGV